MVRPGKEELRRERQTRRRMVTLVTVFTICLLAILARLVDLQLVRHHQLSDRAERQHLRSLKVKPHRGRLLDRRGRALALSIPASSVYANTEILTGRKNAARLLARALGMKRAAVSVRLQQKRSFVWIKRQVTPEEVAKVRRLNLPSVGFLSETRRFYPKRSLAGQVLGFVGIDGKGLEGLEYHFDSYLRGRERTITVARDAAGRKLRLLDAMESAPTSGLDVVLTIDEAIQTLAEEALHKQVVKSKARSGVVIVLDPNDGSILAMAQEPAFNPNTYALAQSISWRNRAIADSYEQGSTMKIVAASAALDLRRVRLPELFFGEQGSYAVGGIVIHDLTPSRWLTFSQVIQKSSNIGAVKIAQRLSRKQFSDAFQKFGFGKASGIDMPGEAAGLFQPLKEWSSSSVGALAIGQEIAATPLQMLMAYTAIANGGELLRPHVLHEVRRGDTVLHASHRYVVRRVMTKKTSASMRRVLQGVITDGTGKLAAVEGYDAAGKTGTAQKADATLGGYVPGKYVASFVGFAPVEQPRLAVIVLIDEPKGKYYGGTIAAPVFREVVGKALYYLRVPSSLMARKSISHPKAKSRASVVKPRGQSNGSPRLGIATAARRLFARVANALFGGARQSSAEAVARQVRTALPGK